MERDNPAPPASTEYPTHAEIAQRAYSLWEEQGRPHGTDVANWLAAEASLQPTFAVILTEAGETKVQLVRELRAATGIELSRVKELVETAPQAIQQDLRQDQAEALLATIRAAGGVARLAPGD